MPLYRSGAWVARLVESLFPLEYPHTWFCGGRSLCK